MSQDKPVLERAKELMTCFYLSQGFMEAPEWNDLGADFQKGFLGLAALERQGSGEPVWVVNDLGELGVKLGERFFFLYKGDNIEYGGLHDDGSQMMWRIVGKREFGETCQPLEKFRSRWKDFYREPLVYTPGLSDGKPEDGEWRPLPPQAQDAQTGEKINSTKEKT